VYLFLINSIFVFSSLGFYEDGYGSMVLFFVGGPVIRTAEGGILIHSTGFAGGNDFL
jgi:hypothetical protein